MIDWDAVSAIGTCIGAFGTFLACSISLWQSHIANVNRLKITISKDVVSTDDPSQHYVGISVANVGNKTVYINIVGYKVRGKKGVYAINPNGCSDGIKTPFADHTILPGRCISFYFSRKTFLGYLHEEFSKGHKIRFCCVDSTGSIYYKCCNRKSWIKESSNLFS